MYHKNKRFRRHQRNKRIKRKLHIVESCFICDSYWGPAGKLDKGKIHCSCPLCQNKSTKIAGQTTNSRNNYSASDLRKFNKLEYDDIEEL